MARGSGHLEQRIAQGATCRKRKAMRSRAAERVEIRHHRIRQQHRVAAHETGARRTPPNPRTGARDPRADRVPHGRRSPAHGWRSKAPPGLRFFMGRPVNGTRNIPHPECTRPPTGSRASAACACTARRTAQNTPRRDHLLQDLQLRQGQLRVADPVCPATCSRYSKKAMPQLNQCRQVPRPAGKILQVCVPSEGS